MRICVIVGHSILSNGYCTSADGRVNGGCLEYKWCKSFGKKLVKRLLKRGHLVDFVVCPEGKFVAAKDERPFKVQLANQRPYDLLIELHLNAFDNETANGCSVLYKSEKGKAYALEINQRLATVFRDRGVQQRNDLYILNQTKPVAVLLETFFCTCPNDYKKAKGKKKMLADLVADGIEAGYKMLETM